MKFKAKIFSSKDQISKQLEKWRSSGDKIVFTNGVFDLIHIGHISYLEEARSLGDRLVLGINSDSSVSRIKGPSRPIKDEANRMAVMAGLSCIDMVILFDKETPRELLHQVRPDILVKGGNYPIEQIVGHEIVLAYGGKVQSLIFKEGYSSTALIEKIKNEK